MLVEHLLRCGYYDTAIQLAQQSDVEHLTNIDLFLVSKQVEESLTAKETSVCLSWCQDNRSKLRRIKSSLEFNVRQQEFIELVRADQRVDAIKHARRHFTVLEEEQQSSLQQVMGLLAFQADTTVEPYRSLFDPKRWVKLMRQFREDNFRLFNLSATSVFAITLQCGLSALKTSHCYRKRRDERNPDCPVCSDLLNQLARPLPVAHCANSKLVCQLSGQPLNEHNQPLVLPNGHVYGEIALKQMAFENEGRVTCVRTKKVYEYSQLEKVFVM
jgi:macrophage erythroblast attacher